MVEQFDLWVTDRCAREDLGIREWPDPEGVNGVADDTVRKFRERRRVDAEPRSSYINNLTAELGRPCYELKDERFRGATWLDRDRGVVFLLAVAFHTSGTRDDSYNRFLSLARAGRILPTTEDYAAIDAFLATRWMRELRDTVGPGLRTAAMAEPGMPFSRDIGACEVTLVIDRQGGGWYAQLRLDRIDHRPPVSDELALAVAARVLGSAAVVDRSSTWYGEVVPWPTKVFEALL